MNKTYQEHFDISSSLRDNFRKEVGDWETEVFSPLIYPAFTVIPPSLI